MTRALLIALLATGGCKHRGADAYEVPQPTPVPEAAAPRQAVDGDGDGHRIIAPDPAAAVERLGQAWRAAGSPPVSLVVLEADEAANSSLTVEGVSVVDGEVRKHSATVKAAGVGLPDTGWAGEVARRAQERMVEADIHLVDMAYRAADEVPGRALVFEFRRLPAELGEGWELQLRILRRGDGGVLAIERQRVFEGAGYELAADALLGAAAPSLAE